MTRSCASTRFGLRLRGVTGRKFEYGEAFRDSPVRRLGAAGPGASGARRLSGLPCLRNRSAGLGRGHRLVGCLASGPSAVGFLPAGAAAVMRVGATVECGPALPALQAARGHNGTLRLSVTSSNPHTDAIR